MAERFVDYWLGDGSCSAMPDRRRAAFAEALQPSFHEWDAVLSERTPLADPGNRRDIRRGLSALGFRGHCRGRIHGAPLAHPQVVNPIVRDVLKKAT